MFKSSSIRAGLSTISCRPNEEQPNNEMAKWLRTTRGPVFGTEKILKIGFFVDRGVKIKTTVYQKVTL